MVARSLQSIVLSAKRSSWRMLDAHADEADQRYRAVRSKVLERDNHTCVFCGFKALKYQEVHHKDDDHGNNALTNLVTACCFCHLCFHLGMASIRHAGKLIFCPELTQAQLANISRSIFVAVKNQGKQDSNARALYVALESRAAVLEEELGAGASDPGSLGQAFLEMTDDQYESRGERLGGLRLLPTMGAFFKQIAYWQEDKTLYGSMADTEWEKLATISADPGLDAKAATSRSKG